MNYRKFGVLVVVFTFLVGVFSTVNGAELYDTEGYLNYLKELKSEKERNLYTLDFLDREFSPSNTEPIIDLDLTLIDELGEYINNNSKNGFHFSNIDFDNSSRLEEKGAPVKLRNPTEGFSKTYRNVIKRIHKSRNSSREAPRTDNKRINTPKISYPKYGNKINIPDGDTDPLNPGLDYRNRRFSDYNSEVPDEGEKEESYPSQNNLEENYSATEYTAGDNSREEVTVAVIDSGYSGSSGKVENYKMKNGEYVETDSQTDGSGHGTKVTDIILNNDEDGNIGKVMSYKIFNEKGETTRNKIIEAATDAIEKGADVINMSFGLDVEELNKMSYKEREKEISNFVSDLKRINQVASENNATVVMAAGNNGGEFNIANYLPNVDNITFVGATNAPYSDRGEVYANGTYMGGLGEEMDFGTSFAAPRIAAEYASEGDEANIGNRIDFSNNGFSGVAVGSMSTDSEGTSLLGKSQKQDVNSSYSNSDVNFSSPSLNSGDSSFGIGNNNGLIF